MKTRTTFEVRMLLKDARPAQADLARCLLANFGIPPEQVAEEARGGRTTLSFFTSSLKKAQGLKERIDASGLKHAYLSLRALKDADWKTRWKKYFKPFNITATLRVIPAWAKGARVKGSRQPVYIDTTFAFGTGLHATTQMMAQLIDGRRGKIGRFLDVGTGSGILALIAGCCGAAGVWAIDADKEAVKTAAENFRLNGFRPRCIKTAGAEGFKARERFDFVAANLLTEDLIRLQKKLSRFLCPSGLLAVSGVHCSNYTVFRRRFHPAGLRCARILQRKGWYAILFKKREGVCLSQ
ncbi:MAG TPA: 50S ribosomal protein L11 methyltransferase [Patescibacteria group bacterium]|nr:50S ribosomal protein L11 methyltransferase [Patescibacteria group bacterium]